MSKENNNNNNSNNNNTLLEGYIKAADKAIRESGRDNWTADHDEARQETLKRLWVKYRTAPVVENSPWREASNREPLPGSAKEFVRIALGHFKLDLKQQKSQSRKGNTCLRPGEHRGTEPTAETVRAFRLAYMLHSEIRLDQPWMVAELKKCKYSTSLSLDYVPVDGSGKKASDALEKEVSEVSALGGADDLEELFEDLLAELPLGCDARVLALVFLKSWYEPMLGGDGYLKLTAAAKAELPEWSKKRLERAKAHLAKMLVEAPFTGGILRRVRKSGCRGAKLLK